MQLHLISLSTLTPPDPIYRPQLGVDLLGNFRIECHRRK